MARITDPGYLPWVIDSIKKEFERVGVHVVNFNIENEHDTIYSLGNYHPIGAREMRAKMTASFTCNESEFKYLQPFCYHAEKTYIKSIIPEDISLWGTGTGSHDAFHAAKSKIEIVYDCEMILHITGGGLDSFIDQFREQTDKLYEAMQSKAFDEEVEKLLTEDEYNK